MLYTPISIHGHNRRLILIFAGWGIDPSLFRSLEKKGYDIAVVWSYDSGNQSQILEDAIRDYDEICLIAWSFGVLMAERIYSALPALQKKTTLRLAVAGTETPVDDNRGIPVNIFKATLDGLDSPDALLRFHRRICGGARAHACMPAPETTHDIATLRRELDYLGQEATGHKQPSLRWDRAIITGRDLIFPSAAQQKAWEESASRPQLTVIEDSPHLPDFQKLLDRFVIPKAAVAPAFEKSRGTYRGNADVQTQIAFILAKKTQDILSATTQARLLEIGCGTGILSEQIARAIPPQGLSLELWDLLEESPLSPTLASYRQCDAELAIRDLEASSLDMIISASTVQWFNSPIEFIRRAWQALRPGGTLLLSLFCHPNLPEAAEALGHLGLPLLSIREWRNALEVLNLDTAEFEIFDEEMVLEFDSPLDVFRHFKLTGVNTMNTGPVSIHSALERYPRTPDGLCRLSYHPLFIFIRKKQ